MQAPKNVRARTGAGLDVDELFPQLTSGMSDFAFSNGGFSFADLVEYILETTGPAWVDVASWVASIDSLAQIRELIECRTIIRARFLIDPIATRSARSDRKVVEEIASIGGEVRLIKNHAKFAIIYNQNWFFVIETSANLNKNLRIESYRVTEGVQYCTFFRRLIEFVYANAPPGGECPLDTLEDYLR